MVVTMATMGLLYINICGCHGYGVVVCFTLIHIYMVAMVTGCR